MVRTRTPFAEIPQFREISRRSCRKMATKLSLAMAYVLCLAVSANADFVSGRVYDPNNQPVPNMTFTAGAGKGQAVSCKTDGSGNFSVYLDAGTYREPAACEHVQQPNWSDRGTANERQGALPRPRATDRATFGSQFQREF